MKALRWYGKKDIRYEQVPEPSPGPGQLKIKIALAGICGADLKEYESGPCGIDVRKVPLTLGHEFSGKVAELGKGVSDFKVGDRVTGLCYWRCGDCYFCRRGINNLCLNATHIGASVDGCMAEYLIAPDYSLYKLPNSLSDEVGVLVETMSVAIHAVLQSNLKTGDTVAIIGAGTIGLCTLLAARAAGASEVYMVETIGHRGEVASAMGARAFTYTDDGEPLWSIMDLTDGMGVDVSFECAGHPDATLLAVEIARRGGTAVIVGVSNKPSSFYFENLVFHGKTVVGSPLYIDEAKAAIAMLEDGRIDVSPLITARVPLKDAVKLGFEKLLCNKEEHIKILLEVP